MSGTAPSLNVSYNPATNRRTGDCADANGNLNAISGTLPCNSGYGYDVENRIVVQSPLWGSVTPAVAYSYRPGNKRVWRGSGYVSNSGQYTQTRFPESAVLKSS